MTNLEGPEWFHSVPYWYYTHTDWHSPSVVTVRRAARDQEVSASAPGTLILRLQTKGGTTRVSDMDDRDCGSIHREGIVPGMRFVLRRRNGPIWTPTVRSVVRKRLRLQISDGDVWTFDTPFFWWQHLSGKVGGGERLVGGVGPTKRDWGFCVDREKETADLLAAVALMHWKWWHW